MEGQLQGNAGFLLKRGPEHVCSWEEPREAKLKI